jgi:hypothetical protein
MDKSDNAAYFDDQSCNKDIERKREKKDKSERERKKKE